MGGSRGGSRGDGWAQGWDGGHVRLLARAVAGSADDVRGVGDRLATASGVVWTSLAADAYRSRLAGERGRVLHAAALLDEAVQALLRHAAVVDTALRP